MDYKEESIFKMMVTPEMAEEWLKFHNGKNRNLSEKRVKEIADDIVNGKWEVLPKGIEFFKDGELKDGQHRLSAIVEAGIPVMMWVATGCEKTTHVDDNKPRSVQDRMIISGLAERGSIYTNAIMIAFIRFVTNSHKKSTKTDVKEIISFIDKYKNGCSFLFSEILTQSNGKGLSFRSANVLSAIFLAFENGENSEKIKEWHRILQSGIMNSCGYDSQVIRLRDTLIMANMKMTCLAGSRSNSSTYRDVFLKCQNSIYAYLRGNNIQSLYASERYVLPEEETVAPYNRETE